MPDITHTIEIKRLPRTDGELVDAARAILRLPAEVPDQARANGLRTLTSYSAGIFQLEASRHHMIDRKPTINPPIAAEGNDKIWRLVWP